jgi:hypothetical protein
LGLRSLTVAEASYNETKPANGQPIDKVYRSRTMRVLAPIWALLMLGNLIWAIAGSGRTVVSASLLFAVSILGIVRVRWPKDTWPVWLFSYKP